MKILVTGCCGILASNLIERIQKYNYRIIGIDKKINFKYLNKLNFNKNVKILKLNFNNKKKIFNFMKKKNFDVIFHLGAITQVLDALKNPYLNFQTNIMGTINILESIRLIKKKPIFIFSSSDKAYGNLKVKKEYYEYSSLKGDFPYDSSKSASDIICQSYSKTYNLKLAIIRSGNIYGPGDFNLQRLIPHTITSLLNNKAPLIRSNGKLKRDYIFVNDASRAYHLIMKKMLISKNNLFIYNIGSKYNFSVVEVVNKIIKLMKIKSIKYKILNLSNKEIIYQKLNYEKIKKEINWVPEYSFKKGLLKTINWYKDT